MGLWLFVVFHLYMPLQVLEGGCVVCVCMYVCVSVCVVVVAAAAVVGFFRIEQFNFVCPLVSHLSLSIYPSKHMHTFILSYKPTPSPTKNTQKQHTPIFAYSCISDS